MAVRLMVVTSALIAAGSFVSAAFTTMHPITFKGPTPQAVSSSAETTKALSTAPADSTRPDGSILDYPRGWRYAGCFVDKVNSHVLAYQVSDVDAQSSRSCVAICAAEGYSVAGTDDSYRCFCGEGNYINGSPTSESDCLSPCFETATEECQHGNRLRIYHSGTLKSRQLGPRQGAAENWAYQGCYSDNINGSRALFWQIQLPTNNTAERCLGLCQRFGYQVGGMEYGIECYCGDMSKLIAAGSTIQDESSCKDPCSGDAKQICGGGNRLSLYSWTGMPLYTWSSPIGSNAGAYRFLIGGVIVPLITTLGTNNKVTFLEKHGTGQPNSTTGAYELDLSQLDNFEAAWRPMPGIKTDIFCAAGITLPDKVGRQLNVGGWSLESTFGVRLYWPDGGAGNASVNGWQENHQELSLLNGRWYPSAMIMANGSILVVGGEVGSNGPPTPTLEILPLPAGGTALYMDWLARTDPNNLYPFLYVLPSKGIFVGYWNEARILDEKTFATVKTLPNMPGSVVNSLAGRTYPLEGTSMLLPQYAPYVDPVTVIICGGSAATFSYAIDNCITIQPDVPGQNWTIERMPSQRVLSCMVALPDGTFLILNGATQGVGGFGLAKYPNLGAVMYDPSQPLHSRMSIMANTIVARMYHSEAILLPDGSVLVSGSDPQEGPGGNPEEYRVEKFLPPYLLNGKTPPKYTITNKDWAYGGSYPVVLQMPYGGKPSKVSLLGAVSSTHGNSMGARTLFPGFSCTGTTCNITAPPGPYICPPGWYQLFILDGPTPSHSEWVRIGGDPANLGAWPNFADFTVPGKG